MTSIRSVISAICLAVLFLLCVSPARAGEQIHPSAHTASRARIIIDNDFGGDPDGLFQLAHQLLSPSPEVRAIIGSHHHAQGFFGYPGTAAHAVDVANQLLAVMRLDGAVPVLKGSEDTLRDTSTPLPNEAVRFIIDEAMREDVSTPLYVVCGAGLTDVASAWLLEPRIAERMRVVWIGGPEYPGAAVPPGAARTEYNLSIDTTAAQVVFNRSELALWQVPRSTYRQALVSHAELRRRMAPESSALSRFLLGQLENLMRLAEGSLGETYILGDSPLVLLTALQSPWEPDPSSSQSVQLKAPRIDEKGDYAPGAGGRMIRVYTSIDNRLMLEDFYAKVASFDKDARPSTRKSP